MKHLDLVSNVDFEKEQDELSVVEYYLGNNVFPNVFLVILDNQADRIITTKFERFDEDYVRSRYVHRKAYLGNVML